jgi:NADH-quinone oxidoreductase subunit A
VFYGKIAVGDFRVCLVAFFVVYRFSGNLKNLGVKMLDKWLFVGLLIVVAVALPILPLVVARILAPRKPNPVKLESYECGMETVGDTWVQFKVQYYIYALVFLVFDVEIIFLFPWAASFEEISAAGLFGIVAGVLFIFLLGDGLLYAWRKGTLEWL